MQDEPPKAILEDHLKALFGYNSFRHCQREIIEAVLERRDVLAILPTGAGKSICYQLPAMLLPGIAVVISPLISLMQDQVVSLYKSGLPAAFLNSSLPFSEIQSVMQSLSEYKLLYIAPERLADKNFIQALSQVPISLFAIDEAHCISQWGHSFRPEYRQLAVLKKTFPTSSIVALTATATRDVETDISAQLAMQNPYVVRASFDRPNLSFHIQAKSTPVNQLRDFLLKHQGESGIIYAATRKKVDETYSDLSQLGFNVGKYHAGLSDEDRGKAQHEFVHGEGLLMVATVAFGMGIHKPDIRFVVHMDMPRSIEQYYQEVGRAGRDDLPSECLMLYSAQELILYNFFLNQVPDEAVRKMTKAKTEQMYALCQSSKCRRSALLHYFGETYGSVNCNGCDRCLDQTDLLDETLAAQKILSCVYRLQNQFGINYVIDVLRGAKTRTVFERGHDRLSTYNLMAEYSEEDLRYLIQALIEKGFLERSEGEYPILRWTALSPNVVRGPEKVMLRKKLRKIAPREKKKDLQCDSVLFSALSQLRRKFAEEMRVPAFVVFGDRTLIEMCKEYPATQAEMMKVNGVGPIKWAKYGQAFLSIIVEHSKKLN
ncbi:MAG: DNA helicase RecQ [Chlamydiota bacterium]